MVAIQSMSQANGLLLLQGQQKTTSAAVDFLSSGVFSASVDGILSLFATNSDLAAQFAARMKEAGGASGIHPDNARHNALAETIFANRGQFPPGEFYIRTELPDGASITTYIPAIGAPADAAPAWSQPAQTGIDARARAVIAEAMLAVGSLPAGRH